MDRVRRCVSLALTPSPSFPALHAMTRLLLCLQGVKSAATFVDVLLYLTPAYLNATAIGGVWSGYWSIGPTGDPQAPLAFSGACAFRGVLSRGQQSLFRRGRM